MSKLKIRTKAYAVVALMAIMSLFFGIVSGVVAGAIAFYKDFKGYISTQANDTIKEVLKQMKEDVKNVD